MSARMDTQCSTEFLREVQKLHKEKLRNDVLNSVQRSSLLGGQSAKEVILGNRYTALSASLVEDGTWEALEVLLTEAFAAGHESLRVVLCGGAGMGKTIAVEKLIWDWAAGSCLQHYTLLLRVCVQALCTPGDSLQGVLLSTHAHLSAEALTLALQTPHKLLLVLDELDGFLLDPPPSDVLVCDLQQPAGGAVLLHSLLQGSLLPGASLLLTSREPVILETVQNIYILGFSHAQRRAYFRGFLEVGVEEVLDRCERAVGVAELWACPAFCWTLCQQAQQECVPDTLSELLCMVTHTLLQEHGVAMQTARELLAGLGKLANHCTHLDLLCCTRSDLITCGLEPFLTSPILFAFLHMVGCDVTSPDGTFSFLSPVLREFLQAVSFYVSQSEYDGGGILEEYQDLCLVFLAGLSDPVQRKLLETSAGAARQRPPALIRESVASSTWRAISYSGLQGPDCAALAFVVSCLGEMEHLNLYMSALTEEQAQKITPAVQLAKSISLSQSRVSVGVITQFGRAMSEGHVNQLDLSYCTLGDEGAQSLCTSLQLSRLHTLTLDRCALSGACVAPLSSAMCAALSVLRMLDLSWNSLAGDSLELLSQTLQSGCCCLTTLRLFDCELTDSCCSSLAAALQSEKCCLVELDLSVNELHQSGAILICDALKAPSCSLEKLCLEMMELTDTCVDELCEAITANNSLTTLILKNNSLTDASVPRMIKLIQDHPIMNELK
ncbi:hypothetical protein P4O66_022647 [Electrophorus voltai]|uniref:NACHT domain-containing protein n=1 Tax=Electrophorus voltai TaxID=2609070 RepID=A0AAD8ZMQ4_9TELE|nr:hypothetical protein P4O66_022647 [Electrophorus voltai]